MRELGAFWITGIILNVSFFILGIIWVFKMMKQPDNDKKENRQDDS